MVFERVDSTTGEKIVDKCSVFIVFDSPHDFVFKLCWIEFHFHTLPFSNCAGKKGRFRANRRPVFSLFFIAASAHAQAAIYANLKTDSRVRLVGLGRSICK